MPERRQITDPFVKPWVAEDAAKNLVRKAVAGRLHPNDVYVGRADISHPDYAAAVGRFAAVNFHPTPKREIAPDQIGVTGFAPEGDVFPLPEVWQRVTGQELPPYEPSVDKPKRSRKKKATPEPMPDAHLEAAYDEMQGEGYGGDDYTGYSEVEDGRWDDE